MINGQAEIKKCFKRPLRRNEIKLLFLIHINLKPSAKFHENPLQTLRERTI